MKKIVFVSVLVIFTACLVKAQSTNQSGFTFNHLALSVKDLNRSVAFYINVFQLPEITNRTANPNIRWISLNEGKELHLISNAEPVTINKSVHLALTATNLDTFIKRLAELNVPYGDWSGKANAVTTRADGIKQIYLQDPDGYWIEINNASR